MAVDLDDSKWQRLERPAAYDRVGLPRTRPENVKREIIRQREYEHLELQYEDIAEFSYRPTACKKDYRMVVQLICQYDELWTDSESHALKLKELGAAPEIIRVVTCRSSSTNHNYPPALIGSLVTEVESRLKPVVLCEPVIGQVPVTLEGEFYAGHSFSNINEELSERFASDKRIALSLTPRNMNQLHGQRLRDAYKLRPYFGRQLPSDGSIVLRHAFPPNWEKPASRVWVHIQPWEFGHLPNDWIDHLRHEVDEIWVMSRYVEQVYINSGVDPEKIQHIPWGVDVAVFHHEAPKRDLPTKKSFRFLYAGGTILRKGFDRILEAYLQEFSADDDVCLVVKDVGASSFYQPQSMQGEIRQAQASPTNPQIVYYSDDFTPGQLASLYAACDCIVAPYRGEGFGLPILEAMACGLAPIVPQGGPTDDFVTEETGYFLPTQVVPAEGVHNLCGPATEFHVSIADLRTLMRQVSSDREATRIRGHRASQFVCSSFTWDKTARQMVDRFCELHEREVSKQRLLFANHSANSSSRDPGAEDKLRLVAILCYRDDLHEFVESLSRTCPHVDAVFVDGCERNEQASEVAKEYGANLLLDQARTQVNADWVLRIDAGYYLKDSDAGKLRDWLSSQSYTVKQVYFSNAIGDATEENHKHHAFIIRTSQSKSAEVLRSVVNRAVRNKENTVTSDFPLLQCNRPSAAKVKEIPRAEHVGQMPSETRSSDHGRLGKSLLIQMASGTHERLLELTRHHHRQYAIQHQMDYWDVGGVPVAGKRAGWGKVPLILAGIEMGYDYIVWLDADAVIVRTEVDLTSLISQGIGMVRHPNPDHWNTGMIVVRADRAVHAFWKKVDAFPENDSAWMEQLAVNNLLSMPEFQSLAIELDLKFNSVPGIAESIEPVIVAGHGLPLASREAIITNALAGVVRNAPPANGVHINSREDFPHALNRLGLVGEAVEVGVCRGEFAEQILRHWNGKMLHLVDPWRHLSNYDDIANRSDSEQEANLQATRSRLSKYHSRVCIHRALSSQAVEFFKDESLDFVYLDANHAFDAVERDLRDWFAKVRRGGILAGHDFLDGKLPEGQFGVASAVTSFGLLHSLPVEVTNDPPWRSWCIVKQ